MTPLQVLIDRAAEMCGSQNKLADRLGYSRNSMSDVRCGRRALPDDKVRALAEMLGEDPAEVWLAMQERRNPFRHSAPGALATWAGAVVMTAVLAVMGLLPSSANAAQAQNDAPGKPGVRLCIT